MCNNMAIATVITFLFTAGECTADTAKHNEASRVTSATESRPSDPISGSGEFNFSATEREIFTRAALDGNDRAAHNLYIYYGFQEMPKAEAYWERIAAENGDVTGMLGLGLREIRSGGAVNCRRALFWIRRATAANSAAPVYGDSAAAIQRLLRKHLKICGKLEPEPNGELLESLKH